VRVSLGQSRQYLLDDRLVLQGPPVRTHARTAAAAAAAAAARRVTHKRARQRGLQCSKARTYYYRTHDYTTGL